ncbi:MAG: SulP family inorganic anion transporter [Polyangiales bacterium]
MTKRNQTLGLDLSASFVVFLVALPLCMGIAIASGMPPSTGLITSIVGGIFVGLISGSPLQVSGPAAGLTVVVWNIIENHGIEHVGLIVLLAGIFQAVAALLGFGRFFRAISPSVVYGMLAGIGVLICASQFHVMVDSRPHKSGPLNLAHIPAALHDALFDGSGGSARSAFFLGVLTIASIVLWGKFRPERLRAVPAPLVGVLLSVAAAAISGVDVSFVSIPNGLVSAIQLPKLSLLGQAADGSVLVAAFSLAVIASAETLLCAAAVDRMQSRVRTNYNRELLAQGLGNAVCGALGGLPMTGVIVRSSANVEAGAQTRLSAILHGVWMLALVVLAPGVLRLIPTASLAGVLVYTGYKLVSPQHLRELRSFGWGSVGIYVATLGGVVLKDLLSGVLLGLALSVVRLLWKLGSFDVDVRAADDGSRLDVSLRGAVTFVGMPRLATILERLPKSRETYLHIDELSYIDHACLVAISDFERQCKTRGDHVEINWPLLEAKSEKVTSIGPDLQPSS